MQYAIKAPSKYVQGEGELKNLGLHSKKIGTDFFVICSANSKTRFGTEIEESFKAQEHKTVFSIFNGEATKEEVAAKTEECKSAGCNVITGVGGGKVIDTAKAVAHNLDLPCIIVPTVASNDAPCSGVAVLYNDEGVVVKAVMSKRNPDLVLVDMDVIANAPARLFSAGLGDALATWFEARACKKSGAKTMARGKVSNTAYMMAKLCYDLLIENGKEALDSVKAKKVTPALENAVEASILLSGIGFESGGLAAAHAINDGFAYVPECHKLYHGEKVAYGTLTQLVLEKAPKEEINAVLAFMKSTDLPMTFEQLGIKEVNVENLKKVAAAACVPTQSTKNLSSDITEEDVLAALIEADKLGSEFLKNN